MLRNRYAVLAVTGLALFFVALVCIITTAKTWGEPIRILGNVRPNFEIHERKSQRAFNFGVSFSQNLISEACLVSFFPKARTVIHAPYQIEMFNISSLKRIARVKARPLDYFFFTNPSPTSSFIRLAGKQVESWEEGDTRSYINDIRFIAQLILPLGNFNKRYANSYGEELGVYMNILSNRFAKVLPLNRENDRKVPVAIKLHFAFIYRIIALLNLRAQPRSILDFQCVFGGLCSASSSICRITVGVVHTPSENRVDNQQREADPRNDDANPAMQLGFAPFYADQSGSSLYPIAVILIGGILCWIGIFWIGWMLVFNISNWRRFGVAFAICCVGVLMIHSGIILLVELHRSTISK